MKTSSYVLLFIIGAAVIIAVTSGAWAGFWWGLIIAGFIAWGCYRAWGGAIEKAQRRQAELNAEAIVKAQKNQ